MFLLSIYKVVLYYNAKESYDLNFAQIYRLQVENRSEWHVFSYMYRGRWGYIGLCILIIYDIGHCRVYVYKKQLRTLTGVSVELTLTQIHVRVNFS